MNKWLKTNAAIPKKLDVPFCVREIKNKSTQKGEVH
jgi:hypothetical protein